ncbi:MAG: hypothetical protein AAF829_01585 [Pseudomonadota bacterium]
MALRVVEEVPIRDRVEPAHIVTAMTFPTIKSEHSLPVQERLDWPKNVFDPAYWLGRIVIFQGSG